MKVFCASLLTACLMAVGQAQYPMGGGMGGMGGGFDSFGGGGGAYTLSMGSGFGYGPGGGMPSFSGISLGGFGGGRSGVGSFPEYGQISQFNMPDYGGGMGFGGGSSGFGGRPWGDDYVNFGGRVNYQPRVIYQ